jgi:hypothetical protein
MLEDVAPGTRFIGDWMGPKEVWKQ